MTAAAILCGLALLAGGVLGWLHRQTAAGESSLTTAINSVLPQLQCGDCGYPGCRPYAKAIAELAVPINLCLPGGGETAARLAHLLNTETPPMAAARPRLTAVIREQDCVGCALCLPVCPTDAIIGAPGRHHAVIAENCVGCGLCLPPCPTDCIELQVAPSPALKTAGRTT